MSERSSQHIDTGTDDLLLSLEDAVATVTLNRPDAKNALTPEMIDILIGVLADVDAADVKEVIVVNKADIADPEVVDRILALYQMVTTARGATLRADALAVEPEVADDPSRHLYALAARVPMVVPTTPRVRGPIATMKMMNGIGRTKFTPMLSTV